MEYLFFFILPLKVPEKFGVIVSIKLYIKLILNSTIHFEVFALLGGSHPDQSNASLPGTCIVGRVKVL